MKKNMKFNIEKMKSALIIILSLIIVFGLAYVVPELKNSGSCKEEELTITEIDMDDYRALLAGDEVSLIYLASPTCAHCMNQKPIMQRLVSEYGIAVNYLNVSAITDSEALELYEFYESMQLEKYDTDGLRTPTMLLVQNGKLLDINLGEISLENLVDFLNDYMTIEE